MSKRIPQSFLTDLLARVDIVEIIGSRIKLKKAGSNYQALCPFHNEKTASFSVSQSKQFYYCFGCGAHGNAIGFLMSYDRMEFLDAVETLAHNAGIEIPYEASDENSGQLQELYQLLQQTNKIYQQQLRQSDVAINYLKQRGLNGEICQKYNIGFSVNNWDKLLTTFPEHQKTLIANGLLTTNDTKKYDRFRNRIMFPIRDVRGRVIGFGGRALGDDTPKYLNSPETPVFHKGHELYGLYEARQSNSNLPYVIIVEGYLDVVALAQFGINNVVATLGTATTSKHVQKLFRYASKLIFCFDGDQAGLKAAWRALENTLPLMRDGVQAQFLFLPKGEDPDSQIRTEGKDAFCRAIDDAMPLSEFLFDHLSKQINTSTMDGRAQMAHQASALLKTMPNGVFKQLMYEKLAKLVRMEADILQNLDNSRHLDNTRHFALDAKSTTSIRDGNVDQLQQPSLVRSAIKLVLHNPKLADHVVDIQQIADIELPNISVLTQLLKLAKQQQNLTTGLLLECWHDKKEAQALATLTAQELLTPKDNLQQEFIGIIERLYEHGREKTIETLMQQASRGEISNKDKIKLQKLISDAKLKII